MKDERKFHYDAMGNNMKVIKKGKIKKHLFRGECGKCGSHLEAESNELKVTRDQRDGTFGDGNCPVCESRVIFYPKSED